MSVKVSIQDYQAVSSVELEVRGFTLVVGDSNRGKSSLQRAINGCLHNEAGDHFVRLNQAKTVVTLNDGTNVITWTKGKHDNSFEVNGEVFDKMGTDSPPILKDLGYMDLEVDGETYNVQIADQFDPPFAVTKSSGKLGALYAAITKTDVISKAATHCSDDLKDIKKSLNIDLKEREQLTSKLKKIPTAEEQLLEVKNLIRLFKEKQMREVTLLKLQKYKIELEKLKNRLAILESISCVTFPDFTFGEKIKLIGSHKQKLNTYTINSNKVESLKAIESVKIPNILNLKQMMDKKIYLEKQNTKLIELQQQYSNLRKVKKVKITDSKPIGKLLDTKKQLGSYLTNLTNLQAGVKLGGRLSEVSLEHVLEKEREIISGIKKLSGDIDKCEDFRLQQQIVKNTEGLYKTSEIQLQKAQEELGSWDTCPLCDQKICIGSH
jgi:energy-coupling factor transporter ATP-binding protein EcfA2